MSKKNRKKGRKSQRYYNHQPKDETVVFVGEVYEEKFLENLKRYPGDVIECVRTDEGYQQISGHSIQLPLKGNVYGISTQKASESWMKAITDFTFYVTRKFSVRLFFVPSANALFVATEAPVEEVENLCFAIMEMNGFSMVSG